MSAEIIKINKLELASELAHIKLLQNWKETIKIYEDEHGAISNYTDQAQDLFNEYYDEYIQLIDSCEI